MLRALPAEGDKWKPFITLMTHNENIKIVAEITNYLELEDERLKASAPPPVALVARVDRPKGNKFKQGKKKSLHPSKNLALKVTLLRRNKKLRAKWRKTWHM